MTHAVSEEPFVGFASPLNENAALMTVLAYALADSAAAAPR
jgi:hypothetical protein